MAQYDSDGLSALLERALALPADVRAAFLDDTCGEDDALRDELASLLAVHDAGARYFERLGEEIVGPALREFSDIPPDYRPADATAARYRLLEELGSGGMGVVFKALDLRLDRFVALKFLPARLNADPAAKKRFLTEAKAASALDHPNIQIVHEIGESSTGGLFSVMAYYEGETLEQKNRRGRMPLLEALDLTRQIASALAAAHGKGIVHRDVKPSNILVTPDGTAKLLDFGIAKLADSPPTKEGTPIGTVAYMSPEQTRGRDVDHRTDLWSLGIVLYEMLAGVRPFQADHDDAVIYAIRHDDFEPLQHLTPEPAPGVARILEKCLAKNPADRYGSAQELLGDLSVLASDGSQSVGAVAARDVRRRVLQYAGAACLLGMLVAGTLFTQGDWQRPRLESGQPLRNRLAVLPMTSASVDADESYVADGITTGLITHLSRIGVRVIASPSVMPYKASGKSAGTIGKELVVDNILEGSVRRAADQVEITLRLVDTKSQKLLWTEHFAESIANLQTVQSEIALLVARRVRVPERSQIATAGTSSPEAYLLYLKGRHFLDKWDEGSAKQARDLFQRSLNLDPTFAEAWTGLGDTFHVLAGLAVLPAADAYPRMKAAADRALQFNPDLPEAHVSLATALSSYYWDFEAAAEHIRRAIALNPSHATAHNLYGEYLRYRGRFAEALEETRQAEELDPLTPVHQLDSGIVLYVARR